MKSKIIRYLIVSVLVILPPSAVALDVFACEPEWGALVRELAGDAAAITVATTAFQDPHRLQARPSLIASARSADLLVCTGAELEIGWLPLLLRRAGNPRIQPGTQGHFMAARFVRKIEIPVRLDRSEGDVHPQGNPHVHLNPRNLSRIARELTKRLQLLEPGNAQHFQSRGDDFLERWSAAAERWDERSGALSGLRLVAHHRSFSYLADWLDLEIVATLENKPGIPPGGAHLAKLLEQFSTIPPAAVIRAPYDNEKPSAWLAERLGVPSVQLPYTVGFSDSVGDLFSLMDITLIRLEELAK